MKIRSGKIGVIQNEEFELILKKNSFCRLIIRCSEITEKQKAMGFLNYAESIFVMDVNYSSLDSAFMVTTYCNYQGVKFQVTNILNNGNIRIWHSMEAQEYFKDFAKHGKDPNLEVPVKKVDEIWEVRKPIKNFPFTVDKIKILKKGKT